MAKSIKTASKAKIGLSLVLIIALSAALVALGIYALPGVGGRQGQKAPNISGFEYPNINISKNADPSQVFVVVKYSDGTSRQIALSEFSVENLDVSTVGEHNARLNFGGVEQIVTFKVVDTSCVIEYKTSAGGYIQGQTKQIVPAGGDGTTVVAVPEEGYYFDGWNDGYKEATRKDKQISDNKEFIARFKKNQYKVIFHYDDGTTAAEQMVDHGEMPSTVPNPASTLMRIYGKQFIGWDQSYENITSDLSIHPIYRKIATDVFLDITQDNRNGVPLGDCDLREEGYYQWDEYANIVATPRPSRLFTGWSVLTYNGWVDLDKVSSQSVQVYEDGNRILFTSELADVAAQSYRLRFMPEEGLTQLEIRANFAYEESTITFYNYSEIVKTIILPYGEAIGPHLTEPVGAEGDLFVGWFRLVAGTDALTRVEESDIFSQDAQLTASYVTKNMTVTFNGTGADNASSLNKTIQVPYQQKIPDHEMPSAVPVRANYNFIGWYLFANGQFTGQIIDGNYTVFGNIEVRPRFEVITYRLNITTVGAGTSYDYTSGSLVPLATGAIVINAITEYTLAFLADTGYSVSGFSSDFGGFVEQKGDPINRVEYTFRPTRDINISVEYTVSYYDVLIGNGTLLDGGSVTYQNADGVTVTDSGALIELSFSHGTSKNFLFEAEPTKYIKSITINGEAIPGIPRNTLTYSLPIENMDKHLNIIVVYEVLTYLVSLPENQANYSALPQVPQEFYPLGSNPKFDISADEGYYISALRINGTAVNLFSPTSAYVISNLNNNYLPVQGGSQDVRVTSFTIEIKNIADDKALTVDIAPIYYNVTVSKIGLGDVTLGSNKTIFNYGESLIVTAHTTEGYYVKSKIVNGTETVYLDRDTQQTENFINIRQDLVIEFVFNIQSYQVFFNGVGNIEAMASVAKVGESAKRFSATYVEYAGSNLNYVITPDTGYYVHSLTVGDQAFAVDPSSNAQLVEINNLTGSIRVWADIRKIVYNIEVSVNNTEYGSVESASGDFTIMHGENGALNITPEQGYYIKNVVFNSVNVTEQVTEGVLALNNITGVCQVSVEFERIVYSLTIGENAQGTIEFTKTLVPSGEEILVSIHANEGYVIDYYTVNGEQHSPAAFDTPFECFYLTVNEDTVFSTYYREHEWQGEQTVYIDVVGNGFIQGNITDYNEAQKRYTISVIDVIHLGIVADTGYYIESINGDPCGSRTENWLYAGFANGSTITVVFAQETYAVSLNNPQNGGISADKASVAFGDAVEFTFTPDTGYELAYFKINGFIVSTSGTSYTLAPASETVNAEATFKLKSYAIAFSAAANGTVTTPLPYFNYGSEVTITIIPNVGFSLQSLILGTVEGSYALTPAEVAAINAADRLNKIYVVDAELARMLAIAEGELKITPAFVSNTYTIDISIEGNGAVTNRTVLTDIAAVHGESFTILIQADAHNFIDDIFVNGQPIDLLSRITNGTINDITNELIRGEFTIDVRQDYDIRIVFAEDRFKVVVAASFNGTTTVGDGFGEVSVKSGDSVQLTMRANTGYHIASVLINGIFVPSTDKNMFPFDDVNHNSNNFYMIENIQENISIRVVYERNTYVATVVTVNKSTNFHTTDDISEKYGTVIISGYPSMPGAEGALDFYDIPHGTSFNIIISPVRSKGYRISKFVIEWKPNTASDIQEITPEGINPNGHVYHFENITNDISRIYVEFERETFNLTERVSSAQGEVYTLFYNPISGAPITDIDSVDSEGTRTYSGIEYGIQYITFAYPPVGYSLQSFKVNNYDRLSYIRNDRYTSYIQSDLEIIASYVINQYSFALRDVSAPAPITKGWVSVNREGTIQDNTLTVMHGTTLQLVITPNYAGEGYAIGSVSINGVMLAISNKNAQLIHEIVIEEDTLVEVIFNINTYNIFITQPEEGGRATIPNMASGAGPTVPAGNVEWGTSVTLTFEIYNGYRIDEFIINGESLPTVYYENGSQYTISNITQTQYISVRYVRKTFSIDFFGNFTDENTHLEDGERIEPYATFNNTVVENSQFNNIIKLHFKPAVGYEISDWYYTINGVIQPFVPDYYTVDPLNDNWYIYTIPALTGDLEVYVTYEIKHYDIIVYVNDASHMQLDVTKEGVSVQEAIHFDTISVSVQVDYGYSLTSVLINNRSYAIGEHTDWCRLTYINNNNVYAYTIILEITDELINDIPDLLNIDLAIRRNLYAVQINPVDTTGAPSNKMIPTGARSYEHGSVLTIGQNMSEGYSIVGVKINGLALSEYGLEVVNAIKFNEAQSVITLVGAVVSKINMHGTQFGDNSSLVFEYVIDIDKHSLNITQYIIETGRDPNEQVSVAGATNVSLATPGKPEVNFNTLTQTSQISDYFTVCSITSSVNQGAPYRFSGYQEYIGGAWSNVESGKNGITILNNTMTYTVKANRTFRAVYYRQYDVIVDVAPQYKYISGNFSATDNSLIFREYLSLTATANGNNVPDSELNLSNQYKFVIDCNAVLHLDYEDTLPQNASQNMLLMRETVTAGGIKEYNNINNNITVVGDMNLYAAMGNDVHFTVIQETVGSENATSGGTATYYIKHRGSADFDLSPTNPSGNRLSVDAFDTVKVVVPVNANHRFNGLFRMLVDEAASRAQGRLIFTGYWTEVLPTADGLITKTMEGSNTVYTIRVRDNSVYKVQYYKTFDVSITVDYKEANGSVLPTVTGAYDSLMGNKSDFYHNGRYDYGSAFTTIVNSGLDLNVLGEKYQFIGWHVRYNSTSWINLDPNLLDIYPEAYDKTFRLVQYDPVTDRDGFELEGVTKVDFKAVYIPIYKVTIVNDYNYMTRAGQYFSFNGGVVQLRNIIYNSNRYNPNVSTSNCINDQELTIPILGSYMVPASYHEWLDTYLQLSIILNSTFKFVEWQYSLDGENYQRFTYQGESGPSSEEYAAPLNSDIYIKPIYQKTVSVTLSPVVFYDAFGIRTYNQAYLDLQNPYVSINDEQFTTFPIVLNFDTDIRLVPGQYQGAGIDPGYDVVGWYKANTGDETVSPDYPAQAGSSAALVTLDAGVGGEAYDVYDIECRYIKQWSITVTTYNNSAPDMSDNAPRTTFDGETMYSASAPTKNSVTRIMKANTSLDLSVNTTATNNNPKFDIANDKLYSVTNLIYEDSFNTAPDILSGRIYAKGNRTIEIIYRTYCTLTITGVMQGGVIMFTPTPGNYSISSALGGEYLVRDGMSPDTTGIDGTIRLENLDVIGMNNGTSTYFSTYGAYLSNMNGLTYECLAKQPTEIDFKPSGVYRKNLTLTYAQLSGDVKPFDSGSGTEESPYLISARSQLEGINNYYLATSAGLSGVYFRLVNSLSLGGWIPICGDAPGRAGFDGILDGNGYQITNFYLTGTSSNFLGLFKKTYGATISNLTIRASGTAVNAPSYSYVGVLVGQSRRTTYNNITISDAVVVANAIAGIITGESIENNTFNSCRVTNCTITATGSYLGTFAGNLDTSIVNNCTIDGIVIESSATLIGGYAGEMRNGAQIKGSKINGSNRIGSNNARMIGGFAGNIRNSNGLLENNEINVSLLEIFGRYHNDSTWSAQGAGGFAGNNKGIIRNCKVLAGTVLLRTSAGGGIAGINETGGALQNNKLEGGVIDFALNGTIARLGGHVGGNFGSITGAENTKAKGGNDWDLGSAMVTFRMHNIAFTNNTANGYTETWGYTYLGGIAGTNESGGSITGCTNNSKLIHGRKIGDNIGASMYFGGIAGYSASTLTNNTVQGIMRSFNFINADMGTLGGEGSEGAYSREYNYMGGVVGTKAGGTMSGNSAYNNVVYFIGIKYSNARNSGGALWWAWESYNRSDCTIRIRGITGENGAASDGNVTGGSANADQQKTGSQTAGTFSFISDVANNPA
jgi:hypothetical protein